MDSGVPVLEPSHRGIGFNGDCGVLVVHARVVGQSLNRLHRLAAVVVWGGSP